MAKDVAVQKFLFLIWCAMLLNASSKSGRLK
jgi:hypothetical protein